MLVQSNGTTQHRHKNGLCIAQRRAGKETLVQWSNGDQRWVDTDDLVGKIVLIQGETSYYDQED